MNLKTQKNTGQFRKWVIIILLLIAFLLILIAGMWDAYKQGYSQGWKDCEKNICELPKLNFSDITIIRGYKGEISWNFSNGND